MPGRGTPHYVTTMKRYRLVAVLLGAVAVAGLAFGSPTLALIATFGCGFESGRFWQLHRQLGGRSARELLQVVTNDLRWHFDPNNPAGGKGFAILLVVLLVIAGLLAWSHYR